MKTHTLILAVALLAAVAACADSGTEMEDEPVPPSGSLLVNVTTNVAGTIVLESVHGDTLSVPVWSPGSVVVPTLRPGRWQLTYDGNSVSWGGCQVNGEWSEYRPVTVEILPDTRTELELQVQCDLSGP